jgi:hypothetical protein
MFFHQGDELSKEVWVGWEWKPTKLWSRGRRFLFMKKKSNINKILPIRLERLFWARNKVEMLLLPLDFGLGL